MKSLTLVGYKNFNSQMVILLNNTKYLENMFRANSWHTRVKEDSKQTDKWSIKECLWRLNSEQYRRLNGGLSTSRQKTKIFVVVRELADQSSSRLCLLAGKYDGRSVLYMIYLRYIKMYIETNVWTALQMQSKKND